MGACVAFGTLAQQEGQRVRAGGAQGSRRRGRLGGVRRTVGEESMRKVVLFSPSYMAKLRYREIKY